MDQLVDHENRGFAVVNDRLNQLSNQFNQLSNRLSRVENNPRQGCARATVAEGLSSSLIINKTTSFTVLVRDCGGYDLTTGGDTMSQLPSPVWTTLALYHHNQQW